jgi:hypothetical protein
VGWWEGVAMEDGGTATNLMCSSLVHFLKMDSLTDFLRHPCLHAPHEHARKPWAVQLRG